MRSPDSDKAIAPIDTVQQQRVRSLTADYIVHAGRIYNEDFPSIQVMFDLKGRAAGMYRVHDARRTIRYNPYIFAKYFDDNLLTTVPHEVAHYVVDLLYGATRVRPHGREWQQVMLSFGAEPKATGNYDLSGIPLRKQRRHIYRCSCTQHQISSVRHNKMRLGKAHYYCRYCKSALQPLKAEK